MLVYFALIILVYFALFCIPRKCSQCNHEETLNKRWIADPNSQPGGDAEKRALEAAQVAQDLGKAAEAAGYDL